MPASPTASAEHIKDVNTRYHDVAAETYDTKWGIDFGEIGQRQVSMKMRKVLGYAPGAREFPTALEIGAGTGYFGLNLVQCGVIGELTSSDISPGMLATLEGTAKRLGLEVETVVAEAEQLPFPDESFDLVFGHAVLHHIPDLEQAMREFFRVLKPGGVIAFCGEPSRNGDRLAMMPKRAGAVLSPLWRTAMRVPPARNPAAVDADAGLNGNGHHDPREAEAHALEGEVDVHAFAPADLQAYATRAGFAATRVRGEELLSNLYGWLLRSLESSTEPELVPMGWRRFAYRSYILLQRMDTVALEPRLPPKLFYNLLISATRPRH